MRNGATNTIESARRSLATRLAWSRVASCPSEDGDLNVLLATPPFTVFRSTDKNYVYGSFSALGRDFRLRFSPPDIFPFVIATNAEYLRTRLRLRLGSPATHDPFAPPLTVRPSVNAVFAYGEFPRLKGSAPVLWEQTFAPQLGVDETEWIRLWRKSASFAAGKAQAVVTATAVSAQWFSRIFPNEANKIRTVPYYLPAVRAISDADLYAKRPQSGPVRFLFVGKEGRRKGLETITAAWALLPRHIREQMQVHIVSQMIDGTIPLPPEWKHSLQVPDVNEAMRDAHVLLFPTKREAFGLVLVEALAAGAAPLTTHAPIQTSIVGNDAALLVDPHDPGALMHAIRTYVEDRELLWEKMKSAVRRFSSEFAPTNVGRRYASLLFEVAGRGGETPQRFWKPGVAGG